MEIYLQLPALQALWANPVADCCTNIATGVLAWRIPLHSCSKSQAACALSGHVESFSQATTATSKGAALADYCHEVKGIEAALGGGPFTLRLLGPYNHGQLRVVNSDVMLKCRNSTCYGMLCISFVSLQDHCILYVYNKKMQPRGCNDPRAEGRRSKRLPCSDISVAWARLQMLS